MNVNGGVAQASANSDISFAHATASAIAEITATQNATINVSGSVNVNAGMATASGSWDGGTGNSYNSTAIADARINANNNLLINAGTGLTVGNGSAKATPSSGVGTGNAFASAVAELSAGNNANLNVLAGSFVANIGATSASTATFPDVITADASALINAVAGLSITASNNITGNSAELSGAGVFVSATNKVDLTNTTTTVGNGTAPGVSGDSLVLDILDKADIGLPANSSPNALFEAGGSAGLVAGDVNMTTSNGYLWFSADQLAVGSISAPAGPLLVQYSPFTPTHNIAFEDLPASPQPLPVNYDNSNHVASLPMTTLVIGSAQQSGPMTVGANGMINIGARNILLLTTPDNVISPSNIITTGIVATSGFVASLSEEVFVTPRLDNFHVEAEGWWLEAEQRKQQLVEEGASDNGMCIAL